MKERTLPSHAITTAAMALPVILAAVAAGAAVSLCPRETCLAVCLSAAVVLLCTRYTEIAFALFLTAGVYKADQRFAVPGVDLTVMFGVITVLGVLWAVHKRRIRLVPPPRAMFLPYMVVSWLAAVSLFYTIAPVYGADKLLRFLTITTLAFFGPFYIFQDRGKLGNFLRTFAFLAMAMLLDILYRGGTHQAWGFVTAFGSDYLALGSISGIAFLIVFLYFFQKETLWVKKAAYLLMGLGFVYSALISGARGPVIALVLTLAVMLAVSFRFNREGLKLSLWITAFLISAFAATLYNMQRFPTLVTRLSALMDSGNLRYELFDAALSAMGTFPHFLTGLGIGGFSVYYFGYDAVGGGYPHGGYPHNVFLELGSETGVAGLAAFCVLVFGAVRKAMNGLKRSSGERYFMTAVSLAFLVFMLVNASKSGDINDNRLLFTAIGLTYAVTREENHE